MGGTLKREGTHVYLWLTHVDVWQRPTQYCEAIFLQLNKFRGKKREEKKKKNLKKVRTRTKSEGPLEFREMKRPS